jgi:hypothetical protein
MKTFRIPYEDVQDTVRRRSGYRKKTFRISYEDVQDTVEHNFCGMDRNGKKPYPLLQHRDFNTKV